MKNVVDAKWWHMDLRFDRYFARIKVMADFIEDILESGSDSSEKFHHLADIGILRSNYPATQITYET
jgi:hypothetical protein